MWPGDDSTHSEPSPKKSMTRFTPPMATPWLTSSSVVASWPAKSAP